jgi:YfiH family protein
VLHAIFTRKGGVSGPPYDALNTSLTVGDNPEHVLQNLQMIKAIMGGRHLLSVKQVHGSDIAVLLDGDSKGLDRVAHADAMITNVVDLALMIKQADCQAVMLFDPVKRVIANVHCGWRGSVLNILEAVVRRMVAEFGSRPVDLRAAIGPSLGPCCAQFRTYREILPEVFRAFMVSEGYFDFWRISRWQLMRAGLEERRIWIAGLCSRCNTDRFFSYRAGNITGRSASVIMLK